MTTAEMPRHNHINGEYTKLLKTDAQYTLKDYDSHSPYVPEPNLVYNKDMLPAGDSQPMKMLPPYIALTACTTTY